MIDDVDVWYNREIAALDEASRPIGKRLQRALDEAEQRLEETYGGQFGFAPVAHCWR